MKNVLIAVDDSKASKMTAQAFLDLYSCSRPEKVVLLYVKKIEGRSLMDEMLGEAELGTLREALKGTEHQEMLDRKAHAVLSFYGSILEDNGIEGVKRIQREGHPADEILSAAGEEGSDIIIIGSRGSRMQSFMMGSVSREVANRAEVPVLIAK